MRFWQRLRYIEREREGETRSADTHVADSRPADVRPAPPELPRGTGTQQPTAGQPSEQPTER